ncbi:MAG: class I SAM-dependent methyltransferase [Myxococcales bacterium]|nr:class I SAM-dependent methyltransferase [Myxococcales bacterium]
MTVPTTFTRRTLLAWMAAFLVTPPQAWGATSTSTFRRIYGDQALRDRFFLFLQNVFNLFPEDRFHQLIIEQVERHETDEAIYRGILAGLGGIKPIASELTYAVPALRKQKREMARQAAAFLSDLDRVDGYLEMGTTGRYVRPLGQHVDVKGPIFVLNDTSPSYGPVDMLERGGARKIGTYVPMGVYDPLSSTAVPDGSVGVISNFIGFHHCPPDKLGDFVTSLRRALRPGGRLLVREHDVVDGTMDTFVALAHDVFNAGVGLTWEENAGQRRHFRSISSWTSLLEGHGFSRTPGTQLQAHDPTDNALLQFVKV